LAVKAPVSVLLHVLSPRRKVVVLLGVFDNLVAVSALPSKAPINLCAVISPVSNYTQALAAAAPP
jgi:hypothetical protein